MTQTLKDTRCSLRYVKQLLYETAKEILWLEELDRSTVLIANGFNNARLMSIRVIESQNGFY